MTWRALRAGRGRDFYDYRIRLLEVAASRAARTRGTLITRIALRTEPRGIADLSLPTSRLGTVAIMLIGREVRHRIEWQPRIEGRVDLMAGALIGCSERDAPC